MFRTGNCKKACKAKQLCLELEIVRKHVSTPGNTSQLCSYASTFEGQGSFLIPGCIGGHFVLTKTQHESITKFSRLQK